MELIALVAVLTFLNIEVVYQVTGGANSSANVSVELPVKQPKKDEKMPGSLLEAITCWKP